MRLLPVLLVVGCEEWLGGGGSDKDTSDSGTAGSDTGDDGGGTTSTDDLDCDASYPTPAPTDVCVTEELSCGDVVYGELDGGSTLYDYDYWEMVGELDALMGEFDALDGPERVYWFADRSVNTSVTVTVHTCFDLWATWILVDGGACDVETYATAGVFEGGDGRTWYTERIDPDGQYDFEFVVEGLYGATGNYRLTVECY
ncbi:MAG: hypothetical protein ABMA64_02265 [Myxococcota bacterium]